MYQVRDSILFVFAIDRRRDLIKNLSHSFVLAQRREHSLGIEAFPEGSPIRDKISHCLLPCLYSIPIQLTYIARSGVPVLS